MLPANAASTRQCKCRGARRHLTDFVADVAGENTDDAFEEEMAAAQKQK